MCFTPCSVATEFSILRATSVSSWPGDAPGSDAVTMTVGRSMSGNCWIFMPRKLITPASVSMMKSSTDGIGLRMHQAETLIMAPSLRGRRGRRAGGAHAGRLHRRRGRRVDDAHRVAVGEEGGARGDHPGIRVEPGR